MKTKIESQASSSESKNKLKEKKTLKKQSRSSKIKAIDAEISSLGINDSNSEEAMSPDKDDDKDNNEVINENAQNTETDSFSAKKDNKSTSRERECITFENFNNIIPYVQGIAIKP